MNLNDRTQKCAGCEFIKKYDYGNKIYYCDHVDRMYSPETCCFVPHAINTLFLNGKKNRGDLPLGVHFDKSKGKYRAEMSFMGRQIKLGTFDTAESAFARYKELKLRT